MGSSKIWSFGLLLLPLLFISSAAHQFEVGGQMGWAPPSGSETETYIEWAEHHRFHVGDILYFKYDKDSVLVVKEEDYERCNVSTPIETFGEGGAMFKFDRHGYFYFIGGDHGNCQLGQKMVIRVMVQNKYHSNTHAPALSPAQGGSSHPFNSTTLLSVTSYLITTITAVFLILYIFMH